MQVEQNKIDHRETFHIIFVRFKSLLRSTEHISTEILLIYEKPK